MNDKNFIYSNSYTNLPNDFYENRKPVPVLGKTFKTKYRPL